ncbi:Fic family protein [Algivirga pacifica]|uniref:Fic family protein n=1 Tax=Algivirga pacifica TaxID=1162670 RepID=A0ABP9DQB4_9BACT
MILIEKNFIYNHPDWPNFTYDLSYLTNLVVQVAEKQGELRGRLKDVQIELTNEVITQILSEELLASSEIEGQIYDRESARQSIVKAMGFSKVKGKRNTDGYADALADAIINAKTALMKEQLFQWHIGLFPNALDHTGKKMLVGQFTNERMLISSGALGHEKVHFMAPPPERVNMEMNMFLFWFNSENNIHPFIKAAITHLWFEVIHPFQDGNGRIGRILIDRVLAKQEASSLRLFSISAYLKNHRREYYEQLEKASVGNLDITKWVEWFLKSCDQAMDYANESIDKLLSKERFWKKYGGLKMNERQLSMIKKLLSEEFLGDLTTKKWSKMMKCSLDTAIRDMDDLMEQGILKEMTGHKRNRKFALCEV